MNAKLITLVGVLTIGIAAAFGQSLQVVTSFDDDISKTEQIVDERDPDLLDFQFKFYVKNIGASDEVVKAKRIELDVDCTTSHALCWELCPEPKTSCTSNIEVNTLTRTIVSGEKDGTGVGHLYDNSSLGESKFRYVFFLDSDNDDSTYVDVLYKHNVVSVEERSIDFNISPNPTTGVVNFNFSDSKSYNLKVLDLLGKIVREGFITSGQSIDLSDNKKGVYFVIVSDNKGRKISTQKLILE